MPKKRRVYISRVVGNQVMTSADLERLHKYMLEIEGIDAISDEMRAVVEEGGGGRSTTAAMANLAEAIQGLVAHMRTEQQMIREWADGQGEQNSEIKKLLERLARQPEKS